MDNEYNNNHLLYSSKKIYPPIKSIENGNQIINLQKNRIILKPVIKLPIKQNNNFSSKITEELKRFHPIKSKINIFPNHSNPNIFDKNFKSNKKIVLPLLPNKNIVSKSFGKLEYCLEDEITKKKRIKSLEEQRNFINLINPGDKNFRYAEYSPGFFKQEGLIIGSTNSIKKSNEARKKINNIYETLDLSVKILDDKKKWKFKIKNEALKNDCDYVANLDNWEKIYINHENENKDKTNNKNKNSTKGNKLNKNVSKKKDANDVKIKKVKIKL